MRSGIVLTLLAFLAGATAQASGSQVHVEARLLALKRGAGCGVLMVFSPGTFLVLEGPPDLVGASIDASIQCADMPRRHVPAREGDFDSFEVGDTYDLGISRRDTYPDGIRPGVTARTWFVADASRRPAEPAGGVTKVVRSARAQIGVTTHYDPAYARIPYPMGDVPLERGVCADVLVRAFRADGIDLQKLVHEDMATHFALYPHTWGLHGPDTNIDHRRVPNLETFFRRAGDALPVTALAQDYHAGDIVSWRLPNGLAHIGLVSDRVATDGSGQPLMIHNIGAGTQEEDVLFAWKIVGHFRWTFEHADERARR